MNLRTYDPSKCTIEPGPIRPGLPAGARITLTASQSLNQKLYQMWEGFRETAKTVPLGIRGTPIAHGVRPRRKRKQLQEQQARLSGIRISQYRRGLIVYVAEVTINPDPAIDACWNFTPWRHG